jgi:tetratricopeptide (TPR) repeat protein
MVNDYAPEPGFFDRWLDDPGAGGAVRDTTSHSAILEFAISRLAPQERQLLSRVAVLRDTASYETIRVISPYTDAVGLHAALKRLEAWELLQWDRHVNTYDLHPAVRGVAFDQLETGDKAGTYKALRDHFAAMPPEDVKRATELDHLKNSIEVFRLLLGAGLLQEAASHYFGELGHALHYSIGAYRVVCELLRELLRAAGPEPWIVLGAKPASYVQGALSIALQHVGEVDEARALEAQSIALDLAESDWANLAIEIRNVSMGRGLALQERGARLCLELCELTSNADGAAAAHLSLAHVAVEQRRYDDARKHLAKSHGSVVLEAAIRLETTGEWVDVAAPQPSAQKDLHVLRARHEAAQGNWVDVLRFADAAIEIVQRTGERAALPFSMRALALAKLGRDAEAREALARSSNNRYSADACFALGLDEVGRQVLARAAEQPSDEHIPHEEEILRAITKLRAVHEEKKRRFLT